MVSREGARLLEPPRLSHARRIIIQNLIPLGTETWQPIDCRSDGAPIIMGIDPLDVGFPSPTIHADACIGISRK